MGFFHRVLIFYRPNDKSIEIEKIIAVYQPPTRKDVDYKTTPDVFSKNNLNWCVFTQ